jgi:PAS domain S-box-containing protein
MIVQIRPSTDPTLSMPPLGADGHARQGVARILITEDRPDVLRSVVRALGEPYACEFATDIDLVREKLASGTFQLALCGVAMPGAPGLGFAEEIVRDYPEVAVVLVTDEDDPEVARRAFQIGVYGYLVEPFWPGQLLITVMNALRRRELELAGRAHDENLEVQRQKIFDMAPLPIFVKDRSYRYILANVAADAQAGLEEGGLVGQSDEAILPPEMLLRTRAADRRMFADGIAHDAEERTLVDGVERVFKTIKFPLFGEDGEVVSVCGISVDVTDKNEAIRLRDELTDSQQRAIDELWSSHQETVDRFGKAIKLHDSSTGDHVNRMASVVALLGERLQLDPDRVKLLRIAAPMHDVGKIAIGDRILRKPGALTAEERAEMQRHTTIGHEILEGSDSALLQVAATISLTHHECFDGNGYPNGLKGHDIPLEGRIAALADVFDALLSDRCYRPAFSADQAVEMIKAGRGSQFDPAIVDILLDNLDEALFARA